MERKVERNIYIAACSKDGGIWHYRLRDDGRLIYVDCVFADRPMYLASGKERLYAVLRSPFEHSTEFTSSEFSGVVSCSIGAEGMIAGSKECLSTHGICSCYIAVIDNKIYTANYLSGSITLLPDHVVKHYGHGPNPLRQEMPHLHQIISCPDGRYLAAVDLGTDRIVTYTHDLRIISEVHAPAGSGPRHIAFSPDGELAYCANELSNDVGVYRYHEGHFLYLRSVQALPDSFEGFTKAAAIRCSGNYVFISHRGYDHITCFSRKNETLSKVGDIPCGGRGPRDFDVYGDYIVSTNEDSNDVAVIDWKKEDYPVRDKVKLPHPLCVTEAERVNTSLV
jgi:6-phosphogluconolactonase